MSTALDHAPAGRSGRRFAFRILLFVVGAGLLWLAYYTGTYFYASRLFDGIADRRPLPRTALESRLHFYIAREILPQDSMWGHHHRLAPGEHMRQYLIGGLHPIDVVYDEHGQVQAIYESFE